MMPDWKHMYPENMKDLRNLRDHENSKGHPGNYGQPEVSSPHDLKLFGHKSLEHTGHQDLVTKLGVGEEP